MGKATTAQRPRSVKDLIASPTFLQSLTPSERSELLRPATAPSSPAQPAAAAAQSPWGSPAKSQAAERYRAQLDAAQHEHGAWLLACSDAVSARLHAPAAGAGSLQDKQQVLEDSILLLEHRAALQVQVEELQQQLAAMQKQHRQQQQHSTPDPTYHAVVAGLRASMAQVSSMASTVSQENRLLAAENKRLAGLKQQQGDAIKQLQARVHQLEGNLLQQLAESSRDTVQQAEAAAVGAKLDAMLAPELLAATAAQPPGSLLEEVAGGNNQLRPLLNEISALRRAQQSLEKQTAQLQLQLSTAERDAQAAAAAAAADKAYARRTITQAHQRLSAALQRLKALAERQQQQDALLQEREAYIARLERHLVQQNSNMVRLATNNTSGSSSRAAGRTPASVRDGGSNSRRSAGGSTSRRPGQLQLQELEARPGPALPGPAGTKPQAGNPSLSPAVAPAGPQELYGSGDGRQQHHQQRQQQGSPLRSPSPQHQQHAEDLPQQAVLSPGSRRTWQLQQQQEQQQGVLGRSRDERQGTSSSSRSPSPVQPSSRDLAVSRTAVALQCRQIMAHTSSLAPESPDGTASDGQACSPASAAPAEDVSGVRRSKSPGRGRAGGSSQHGQAPASAGQLPSFTAAATAAGRSSQAAAAGLRAHHLRQVSSRSSAGAGAAAKRIAAAAAAVAALEPAQPRGLWGNTTTLGPGASSSRGGHLCSPSGGRLTPQQLQVQRQLRLRELLQQKQRPRPAHPPQEQGHRQLHRGAAVESSWQRRSHQQQQQEEHTDEEEEQEGAFFRGSDAGQGGEDAAAAFDDEQQQHAPCRRPREEQRHGQQQQLLGVRSASAPPPALLQAERSGSSTPPALRGPQLQHPPGQRQTSASPAGPAGAAAGRSSPSPQGHLADDPREAQLQPGLGASAGEGLMGEVLAMQQNLNELEQDMLQLGCEFD